MMPSFRRPVAAAACLTAAAILLPRLSSAQDPARGWKIHDLERPRPRVVTPGATVGAPPSDAIWACDAGLCQARGNDPTP